MNQGAKNATALFLIFAIIYMLVYICLGVPELITECRMWRRRRELEREQAQRGEDVEREEAGHVGGTPWREEANDPAGVTYPDVAWLPWPAL